MHAGAQYAVKLMTVAADGVEEKAREISREMMNDELKLMAMLDHPNIIRVHEYFLAGSVCCIVMQLLRGPDLMDQLDETGHSEADVQVLPLSSVHVWLLCMYCSLFERVPYFI